VDVKEFTLIAANVVVALGRLDVLGLVIEDDMAARDDVIGLRVVLNVIGPEPDIQVAHVYVTIRDVSISLFSLLSSFQAHYPSSYGNLNLRANCGCKAELEQESQKDQVANAADGGFRGRSRGAVGSSTPIHSKMMQKRGHLWWIVASEKIHSFVSNCKSRNLFLLHSFLTDFLPSHSAIENPNRSLPLAPRVQ
jgi:hypothetical protein